MSSGPWVRLYIIADSGALKHSRVLPTLLYFYRSRILAGVAAPNTHTWLIRTQLSLMMPWLQKRVCRMLTSNAELVCHKRSPSQRHCPSMRRGTQVQRTRTAELHTCLQIIETADNVQSNQSTSPWLVYIFKARQPLSECKSALNVHSRINNQYCQGLLLCWSYVVYTAAVLSTCMSSSAYCNKPSHANELMCLRIRETACMYCAVAEYNTNHY